MKTTPKRIRRVMLFALCAALLFAFCGCAGAPAAASATPVPAPDKARVFQDASATKEPAAEEELFVPYVSHEVEPSGNNPLAGYLFGITREEFMEYMGLEEDDITELSDSVIIYQQTSNATFIMHKECTFDENGRTAMYEIYIYPLYETNNLPLEAFHLLAESYDAYCDEPFAVSLPWDDPPKDPTLTEFYQALRDGKTYLLSCKDKETDIFVALGLSYIGEYDSAPAYWMHVTLLNF